MSVLRGALVMKKSGQLRGKQGPSSMAGLCLEILISLVLCVSCLAQDNIQLSYSIPEEQPVDTFIANIGADSNISLPQIRYNFLAGEDNSGDYFAIDSSDGSLLIKEKIDREILTCGFSSTCVLSLSFAAESPVENFFKKINVAITVVDINDNRPTFSQDGMAVGILETLKDGSIPLAGALDADSGNNTLQRYYILHDYGDTVTFETQFETVMDGKSTVKLIIKGEFDRETQDFYQVTLVAEDGGRPVLSSTLLVNITILDVNDNSPEFSQQLYNTTIKEDISKLSSIIQVTATDPDLGLNGEIVYKLSTNQLNVIHDLFSINETSGILSTKVDLSSFSSAQYRVIVEASDKGEPEPLISQAVVHVNVLDTNNNPPEITLTLFSEKEGKAEVSEDADVGKVIAHIALKDRDTGINGVITCEIASDDDLLSLAPYGENEYTVVVATRLDREIREYIFVIVNCNDKGTPPLHSFVEFSVKILDENDNDPSFLKEIYFVDVYENNAVDRNLVQVSAIDVDAGAYGQVYYSLWTSSKYSFSVDSFSGFVKTMSAFNREDMARITVHVYATDGGRPSRTATATVVINVLDRNDNDPTFSPTVYDFTVSESVASGSSVGAVTASDSDIEDNGRIGFLIDADVPFTIDSSGTLKTNAELDRESKSQFNFLLTVYDHGVPARNSTATVLVRVADENDNEPIFSFPSDENYTVVIPSSAPVGGLVARIEATDKDEGLNAQLFYSIQNANDSSLFRMDGFTGVITLTRDLATQDQEIFYLILEVRDNGNVSKSAVTTMSVFISREVLTTQVPATTGANVVIAITVGTVTFVLIFTIILILCILKIRGTRTKQDDKGGDDRFYDKPLKEKRVQFADLSAASREPDVVSKATTTSPMATFQGEACDGGDVEIDSREDFPDSSASDKQTSPRDHQAPMARLDHSSPSGSLDSRHHHSSPRVEQLAMLHSHNALLHEQSKKQTSFATFGLDDNHSETSAETTTSDSGRGGSESDIHSTSLSQSHDSDNIHIFRKPFQNSLSKPWASQVNVHHQHLHHPSQTSSKLQQIHPSRSIHPSRPAPRPPQNANSFSRGLCTQSHSNFDRSRFVRFQEPNFPPPPSDLDRSYMTYDEEDDDCSTTTSGSYTIDHEDVNLDIHSPGLRGCLV